RLLEGGEVAKARDAAHQPGRLHADDLADGDEVRDGVHELDAVRGGLHAQLEAIVLDADAHGGDAIARAGDLLDGEKAARSLEGEGQAQVAWRESAALLEALDLGHDSVDVGGRLRLGDREAVKPGMHGGIDVVSEQGRVVVHAYEHLGPTAARQG